ncbi:MAG: ATP-binding protein [Planctomycetota bacterium]
MSDKQKNKAELLSELRKLRRQLAGFQSAQADRGMVRAAPREALGESERQYRSTLDAMGDAIHVVDRNLRIRLANRALREWIHELKLDEDMIGKTVFEVFPFLPEEVLAEYRQVLESGQVLVTEEDNVVGDLAINTETRKIPIVEGTQTVGVVTVIRDITARKQMEAEILRARKLESLGVLAGGIAHDFNNILTGVIGNISLAKVLTDPKGKILDRLAEAERAAMRAKDLTRQLLTFAKGGMSVKRIVALGGEIIDAASLAVSGSRCRCDFSVPDGLWLVEADSGQIGQAVSNIVLNAVQAMPQGGVIRVSAENVSLAADGRLPFAAGDYIKIRIADEGVGIPEKYIENIFDPYFTTKQTGTGLGLTTCYSIIRNHGGHIAVKSTPGVGTTFDLYLPRAAKGLKPGDVEHVRGALNKTRGAKKPPTPFPAREGPSSSGRRGSSPCPRKPSRDRRPSG